jgi:uncharacterized protein YecE (DUF72 family)
MDLLTGTSGFAYKEWKGAFYPLDVKNDGMLAYYAGRLGTVEINNTFYRSPKESVVAGWADQVPDTFRFVLKAPQRITHFGRLVNVESELDYFLGVSNALGAKRGPTLFQLPPNMKADLDRLTAFTARLPRGWPAAFEFRHASWFDDATYALLRERHLALVAADTDDGDTPLEATTTWGYVRLRREAYTEDQLVAWRRRLAATGWERVYVFFKHEDAATGPLLAERFATIALR